MKSRKEQRRATKSDEKQQKATKSNKKQQRTIGAGKTKTGKKKPIRAMKGTKSPNGNQALGSNYYVV